MRELYKAARQGSRLTQGYGKQVHYLGIGKHLSVYNATPPVWLRVKGEMRRVSIGRVEHPDDWAHSRIMSFERKTPTEYYLIPDAPVFYGEDPAVTTIGNEIVLATVNVSAVRKDSHLLKTDIRRADDLMGLWECWRSIPGKDNHMIPIDNDTHIAVTTRPQGGEAGRGKMAYIELDRLDDLCTDTLRAATIIETSNADDDTWEGSNELHDLAKKHQIGMLTHRAFEDNTSTITNLKTYFILLEWLDRKTLKIVDREVLAIREDFPASGGKTPALCNVAFGTGLVIPSEPSREYAELYAGIGDSIQAFVQIHNPKIVGLYD
ncbi:MAG: DUF1861 family protein [bacterium]|nr:DUF1861 family protein [bacterium]